MASTKKSIFIESSEFSNALFSSINDAIFIMDGETFIDCNSKTLELFGCKREDIIGQPPYKFSPAKQPDGKDSKEKAQSLIKKALQGEALFFEWTHSRLNRSTFDAEVSLNKMSIAKKDYILALVRDVSERKQIERALEKEKSYFENLFQNAPEAIVLVDLDSNIIRLNDEFTRLFGYTSEEAVGKNVDNLLTDDVLRAEAAILTRRSSTGDKVSFETTRIKKDGSHVYVSILGAPIILKGKKLAVYAIYRDITERKKVEEELKKSEEKFRSLTENINIGVYRNTTGDQGRFIEVNPAIVKIFGYDNKEEFLAVDVAQHYRYPNVRKMFNEKMMKEGFVENEEIPFKRKDGSLFLGSVSATAVKDDDGKVLYFDGVIEDVTQRKEAEQQITKFNKELTALNESKDKLFSIIAHDLKSPFTALLGYSDFLVNDFDDMTPEEIKEYSGYINKVAKNVFELLENLLDWSRIQTDRIEFEPEIVDLYELIQKVTYLYDDTAISKGIKLTMDVKVGTKAFSDENMTYTIIRNLVSNALKFTNQDGEIKVALFEKENELEISVSDSGIGMSDADLNKLFKIGVHHTTIGTGEEKGTGLGLILCKELVEKNNGRIWVESKLGEGTTFFFTLPKPISD